MISWIFIAVIGYLLLALSGVADKFLLTHAERHPVVFAFYIGITGPLSFVLAPFGLKMLSAGDLLVAIAAGVCFTVALYYLYSSIQQMSVSRILPIEGGLVPMFTLIMAYTLLGERLSGAQYEAFILLVLGAVLISYRPDWSGWSPKFLKAAIMSAFLFALSFTLTKYIFDQSNFVSGMVWTRLGFFITALAFLVPTATRKLILNAPKKTKPANIVLYYSSRATGTVAGFLQNFAISLGSVSIVNALQGVQFLFLLLLTTTLSVYFPKVLKEKVTPKIIALKLSAIVLITIGLVLLTK